MSLNNVEIEIKALWFRAVCEHLWAFVSFGGLLAPSRSTAVTWTCRIYGVIYSFV